jgi:alginate O-acetyltransferase complex protein AlgI
MLFNSLNFAIFLPVVFILYWFVANRSIKYQNILLLVASYFFYASWDWRFLFLLMFSTGLDYYTGLRITAANHEREKKFWFWLSLIVNLGFLGVFKYYNFFAESFATAISNFGLQINPKSLDVILPVGISFYTFHGLSYVIDIYKGRIKAEKNLIDYSVFVSFFPLLVAGPIERATHLLPQIQRERKFNYTKAVDGMRQILWGLFKKIVIADNCAQHADLIFNNSADYSGFTLFLGALFFTFQIYGDFSGYSDIALGTARLFGVELLRNFAFPYFSRDIAEFWRRWHISLSTWFRDYLYIPLGGSKGGTWIKVRNTFIIFIVSGFWHGANWTFIAWGLLNALFIMPSIIFNTNRDNLEIVSKGKYIPTLSDVTKITITFCLTVFAWIFFRAESITHAFQIISSMFSGFLQNSTLVEAKVFVDEQVGYTLPIVIILFFVIEWVGRESQFALADLGLSWSKKYRIAFYYVLILLTFFLGGSKQGFIYFQF